jgi:hypothetical protein
LEMSEIAESGRGTNALQRQGCANSGHARAALQPGEVDVEAVLEDRGGRHLRIAGTMRCGHLSGPPREAHLSSKPSSERWPQRDGFGAAAIHAGRIARHAIPTCARSPVGRRHCSPTPMKADLKGRAAGENCPLRSCAVPVDRIPLRKLNPLASFRKAVRAHHPAHEPNGARKL